MHKDYCNQSTNQPTNQPTNKPTNQSTKKQIKQQSSNNYKTKNQMKVYKIWCQIGSTMRTVDTLPLTALSVARFLFTRKNHDAGKKPYSKRAKTKYQKNNKNNHQAFAVNFFDILQFLLGLHEISCDLLTRTLQRS